MRVPSGAPGHVLCYKCLSLREQQTLGHYGAAVVEEVSFLLTSS